MDPQRTSVADIQRMRGNEELTAEALTAYYMERITDEDASFGAVLCTDATARLQARDSDMRRRAGRTLGPLDGIPVLLKDNIDTVDLPTTAGSRVLRGTPPADAVLVHRLRANGAVVLGKTNLSEWGNFRSVDSVSGWSGVGGQTRNPYGVDRSPGGSSSGSAVAVAMAFSQVAVGTETIGSIIAPAAMNGVVGVRPTRGRISGCGLVPISLDQDTPGPLARTVADAALTLSALSGPCGEVRPGDYPLPNARAEQPNDTGSPLAGVRLGLCRVPAYGQEVANVVDSAVASLQASGAEVVVVDTFDDRWLAEHLPEVLLAEFRRDIGRYLSARPEAPDSLAAVVALNRADVAETGRFAAQDLLEAAVQLSDEDAAQLLRLRSQVENRSRGAIKAVLATERLDAIIAPSAPLPWPIGEEPAAAKVSWSPGAAAGWPEVTVPAGSVDGLPVGISFLGPAWSEERLLRLASAYEHMVDARTVPPTALSSRG